MDYQDSELGVIILAGGKSSRMGTDKGLIKLKGIPLVQRAINNVKIVTDDIVIVTNNADGYKRFGYQIVGDIITNIGPLGGLYSGFINSSKNRLLVVTCDMPFLSNEVIKYMNHSIVGYDAVVPIGTTGRADPLSAIYRRNCVEQIKDAIDGGERKVVSFFSELNIRYLEFEEISHINGALDSFLNVKTKEDFRSAEIIIEERF